MEIELEHAAVALQDPRHALVAGPDDRVDAPVEPTGAMNTAKRTGPSVEIPK